MCMPDFIIVLMIVPLFFACLMVFIFLFLITFIFGLAFSMQETYAYPETKNFISCFFVFAFFFFKSKRHLYKCKNFWIWKFPSPIDMSKEIMFGFESKSILPQFFLISNLILCYFVCVVKEKERERN